MSYKLSQPQFALSCQIEAYPSYSDTIVVDGKSVTYKTGLLATVEITSAGTFNSYVDYDTSTFGLQNTVTYGIGDVRVGDWIGDFIGGGAAYQILHIKNTPDSLYLATFIAADIDGYSVTSVDGFIGLNTGSACIFRVNEDSIPMLATTSAKGFLAGVNSPVLWVSDMVARFALRNNKTQYVTVYQPVVEGGPQGKDFVVGESVYIDSNGVFQKSANSLNISDTVGIVTSIGIPSDDWFSFRPSGKYFDKSRGPEDFFPTPAIIEQVSGSNVTLTAGMKLYINPNSGRQYTTVAPASNPYATWIMISATRAIYIAGSGGGGGGGGGGGAVQVFDGGDPTWASAPPTTIYPVLDCGGIL